MAKKKTVEKALNIDSILFNCRDYLRAARNSGSFFEKRDMMLRLVTEQIEKAAAIYHTWQSEGTDGVNYEIPELYRSVGIDEIESKGWALTPSKYIEFIDHDLDIDYEKEMARIQSEMKDILKQEKKSQQMLEEAFRGIGYGID